MPYITKDRREIAKTAPSTPGELNYALCMLFEGYIQRKGASYTAFNDIGGAINYANLEWYRRKVVEYEQQAIARNGDVFV